MKQEIIKAIQKAFKEIGLSEDLEIQLSIPSDLSHGDYTSNVAMQSAKILKKNPMDIASLIVQKFDQSKFTLSEELKHSHIFVEKKIPGFINFWFSKEELLKNLQLVILSEAKDPLKTGKDSSVASFPQNDSLEGKKIVVEFTDPNPFKEFHIGHVYTNTVGESLSRILEANGAIVWRADYYGDVGMHIAKSLYGILAKFKDPASQRGEQSSNFKSIEELEKVDLRERIKFMGQAYALGSTMYEESDKAKEDIKHLNKLIYISAQKMWQKEKGLESQIDYQKGEKLDQKEFQIIYDLYTKGREWSLEYFDSIYDRLGMKFDGYYPESIAGEKGYQLVRSHIKDGIFEENEGAIIFSGVKSGLHTRVFINSLGFPTYEAKELGLAPWKYEDFKYEQSIIVTGNEIKEYFKVLIAAMLAVEPKLGKKTTHLPHGMVRLPEGKMSSRTGKIVTGESLLDEAVKRAKLISKETAILSEARDPIAIKEDSSAKPQNDTIDYISEQVGIGAVKYAFLRSSIGSDLEFDFETSLSLNGNSGPYIQYTFVRTQSILAKPGISNIKYQISNIKLSSEYHPEEIIILRKLCQFSNVVEEAGKNLAPSTICEYLFKLSQDFNNFYQKYRILDVQNQAGVTGVGDPEGIQDFRIALTRAVGSILKTGLYLLGIEAPKRM